MADPQVRVISADSVTGIARDAPEVEESGPQLLTRLPLDLD